MADRRGFTNLYQNIPVQPLSGYSDPSAFIRVREAIRGVEDQLVQIRGLVGTSSPGFVTSVGLTAPTIFTVTGSPVTTSGTIALALASQAARSVFAAPTSGAGTPAFRALETADIQSGVFGVSRGGTGLSTYAAGDILYSDATNSLAKLPVGSTGQVLKVAGGVPTWAADIGFANPMTTLGDLIYGAASGTATRLAGDTTDTRKFLRSLSVMGVASAPVWDTVTKTDVGLSNVENTALSTWGGSTNLVTLGTVTTGTWNATKINVDYGGTGLTSVAANALLIGSTATSLGTIGPPGSAGTFFLSYSSTLPGYQWTDTIGVADGGTGQSSYTTGDMLYASGTTTLAKLPLVSAGIMYGGASAPAWTAAADFTWDQTNKRVGIGTTTPLYPLHVEKNQDATTYTLVYNSNSGASARSVALVNTAAASVGLYSYSSGYTTSGGQIASGSAIGATGSNGLSIIATAATGSIRFYTSSTSAFQGVVTDTGNWGFGTDATAPTSLIYAAKNQNAATSIRVINTDAGVNASANVFMYTTATTGLELTSPGASSPNQLKLFSPLSGGLIMESSNASGFLSIATGGTYPGSERFRIDASGNATLNGLLSLKGARSYLSGGGGAGTAGYYAPIVTLDITAQFATATVTLAVAINGNSGASSEMDSAIVQLRFKQQNAMGSSSIVDVEVLSATTDSWDTDSFIFIQTANTVSNSTGTLYVELINSFCNMTATVIDYFLSTSGASYTICTASTSPSNAVVAPGSLPAGTQTKPAGFFVAGSGVLKMYAGSAERVRVTTAGRVGIGTSTPQTLMHLDTTGAALDTDLHNNTDVFLAATNAGTGVRLISSSATPNMIDYVPAWVNIVSRGTANAPTAVQTNDYLGRLLWQGIATGGGRQVAAEIRAAVDDAPGASYVPGRLEFYTAAASAAVERMRIDDVGNVGIGTTPSYRFHVDQAYTGAGSLIVARVGTNVSPAAANANTMYNTYNTLTMNANATGSGRGIASVVLHRFASNPGVLAAYTSQIDNNDANTATSTIPDAIGFWALTPSQNASGGTITRSYGLFVQPQSGTNITNSYGVYVNGSSDINYFAYRVGIGLNSPSETLHALGLVRFDKSSAAAYPNIRLRSNNDSYVSTWAIGQAPSSNNFLFAYNDGTSWFEYARITTTGNVGIGTSPGIRLDVSETQAVATSATFSAAAIRMNPVYTATGTINVKHRYIHFTQPTISGGTTTFTDAHTMYFDAAAGTHRAVDAGTTKTTPGTVNAWVKIDVNGNTYYIPAYTSKTA